MELEFENGVIPEAHFHELGFGTFLELFEMGLPIIPRQVLRPFSPAGLKEHYQSLKSLESQVLKHGVNLERLLEMISHLPSLDQLLPFFRDEQLESYHLFELGEYVGVESRLQKIEKGLPLPVDLTVISEIRQILEKHTRDNCSTLVLSDQEKKLQAEIEELVNRYDREISSLEKRVAEETGIRMIYPYPKEIGKDSPQTKKALSCQFIEAEERSDYLVLKIKAGEDLQDLLAKKAALENRWSNSLHHKLRELNRALEPCYERFVDCYQERQKRALQLLWLRVKEQQHLVFPSLRKEAGFRLQEGQLPALAELLGNDYQPLNLDLNRGVSVLYGANMTGKTTVLKTIYFLSKLVAFGLPVPAESLELSFPRDIALQLKSSGRMQSGLSGFGDEIQFFCDHTDSEGMYLIDELFHSTDPQNGVLLSQIFLEELSAGDAIYFCTSHYPEVTEIASVDLFRMKDFEGDLMADDLEGLMKKIPYQLESVSREQLRKSVKTNRKPLQVALHFPLSDAIKQKLLKKLET